MKILIATTNPGKFEELQRFLKVLPYEFISLADIHLTLNVEETGETFEENAILKAMTYAKASGFPTIADDGGFEIDILDGAPGVKSHRWVHGNRESTDEELISYTMKKMKDVSIEKRGAQLRLVLAFCLPNGEVWTTEASIRGLVADTPSANRTEGFPYRSLLFLPEIHKYYDHHELTTTENQAYNHRKKAVDALIPIILKKLC